MKANNLPLKNTKHSPKTDLSSQDEDFIHNLNVGMPSSERRGQILVENLNRNLLKKQPPQEK